MLDPRLSRPSFLCAGVAVALLSSVLHLIACRAAPAAIPGPPVDEVAAVRETLAVLYAAFCFDPGAEPDWETQRRVYLEGACFVPPITGGRAPVAEDTDTFLAGFRSFATGNELRSSGFHERIVGTRIDVFGGVAHAFVAFEGFLPGDGGTESRGLDSIQLVHDGDAWRLVSFTTQYENEELRLPDRFKQNP